VLVVVGATVVGGRAVAGSVSVVTSFAVVHAAVTSPTVMTQNAARLMIPLPVVDECAKYGDG
jgi:hypothetical protein